MRLSDDERAISLYIRHMRQRLLTGLGDRIQRHRVWVVAVLCVLFGFSVYWVATGHLKINTSRHGLVNEDEPQQMR